MENGRCGKWAFKGKGGGRIKEGQYDVNQNHIPDVREGFGLSKADVKRILVTT